MLRNDRQLSSTHEKLRRLQEAVAETADPGARASLLQLIADLAEQIEEYERVTSGQQSAFVVYELDRLWEAFVKARLARGWTQRQLAAALGVSEQMVQKDEAGGYQRASLSRLADVIEVLGYTCSAYLHPVDEGIHGAVTRVIVSGPARWTECLESAGRTAEPPERNSQFLAETYRHRLMNVLKPRPGHGLAGVPIGDV